MGPAREAAARAEELDSEGSEGPAALAQITMFLDWDIRAAGAAMRKALARSPGSAKLHHDYAFVMRAVGDLDGAITGLETATRLDPLSPSTTMRSRTTTRLRADSMMLPSNSSARSTRTLIFSWR